MNLEQQDLLKIRTTEARLLGGFKITGLRGISSTRDMSMLKQLSALFSTILPYGRESAALQLLTTYKWAYNPTSNPPKWPYRGYPNYK